MFTDLVAFRTILVEQSQPLRLSLQNQKHHSYQNMVYALQEHDYETCGEGNSQMAFILVKQEVRVYLGSKQIGKQIYFSQKLKVLSPLSIIFPVILFFFFFSSSLS